MEEMSACPCLLRAPGCQALILLHVDDLLVVGDYSFIELQLLPVLREKYKLSMEVMREPGDEATFLKRNHVLISKTEMVIYPHEKHFHKLFDLLKIKRSWKPKNVPSHTMINEVDSSAELGTLQLGCCSTWLLTWWNASSRFDIWHDAWLLLLHVDGRS